MHVDIPVEDRDDALRVLREIADDFPGVVLSETEATITPGGGRMINLHFSSNGLRITGQAETKIADTILERYVP